MHVDQIFIQQVCEADQVNGSKPSHALAMPLKRSVPGHRNRTHAASPVNADTSRFHAAMRSLMSIDASPLPNT